MKTINQGFEEVPLDNLKMHPRNANQGDFGAIQESIDTNGFFGAVTANRRTGHILAGNHRYKVAKDQHAATIPVIWVDVDEEAELRILLADNRTTRLGHDDENALAALLSELALSDGGLAGTGFDGDDLDDIIERMAGGGGGGSELLVDPDDVPENAPTRCNTGDLWQLGRHRLLCGDSTKREDVERLMGGEKASLCFTSPPYKNQRDYTSDATEILQDWDALMSGVFFNAPLTDDAQILVNLGLIHKDGEWIPYWETWIKWMQSQGWKCFGWYVWDQGAGMPGDWNGRLAPSHEFIWHFNKKSVKPAKARECIHAGEKHSGKGQRGKDGYVKQRSHQNAEIQSHAIHDSVFRVNRQGASHDAGGHPAPYPVGLPVLALESWGGNVFEPFCGSGTTIIAAEQLGRKCYGIELSPRYCDVILARWEKATGQTATLLEAGNGNEGT